YSADGLHILPVEHRLEGSGAVDRLPHSTAGRTGKYGDLAVFVHRVDGRYPAAHDRRTDVAGSEAGDGPGIEFHRVLLRHGAGKREKAEGNDQGMHGWLAEAEDAHEVSPLLCNDKLFRAGLDSCRSRSRGHFEALVFHGNVGFDLGDGDFAAAVGIVFGTTL